MSIIRFPHRATRIACLIAVLVLTCSCSFSLKKEEDVIPPEDRPTQSLGTYSGYNPDRPPSLTNFVTADLDGNTITHEFFKDFDLTMLTVWDPGSEPSVQTLATIGGLAAKYHNTGVGFLGIVANVKDEEDQLEQARKITAEAGAKFPQLLVSNELYMAWLISVEEVPQTIFLDSKGQKVGMTQIGGKNENEWAKLIDAYLNTARGASSQPPQPEAEPES